jgi:hypothetical protein
VADAEDRGWGDCGVPDDAREQAYAAAHVVPATIAGVTWRLRREVVPIFRVLLEKHVVPTIGPITKHADDWSYAPRCVRGTGPGTGKACVISNHAWALAIDVNATQNAMGGSDRDGQFPPDFGDDIAYLMIRWGGDYTSRTDPMHFEFIGTPADARRIAAQLEGGTLATLDSDDLAAIEKVMVKVLNTGTGTGYTTWAATMKGAITKLNTIGQRCKELASGLAGARTEIATVRGEVAELREQVASAPVGGGGCDPQAIAVATNDLADQRARDRLS